MALPARNLAIAERDGYSEMLAPCPMCSMELLKTIKELGDSPALRREIAEVVELPIEGKTQVVNIIQVLQMVGVERIREAVKRPLSEFRPACYYGCLLTRPAKTVQFDDCEQPHSMEDVLEALGAKTVRWNYATECCGAGMTMANERAVLDLSNKILGNAAAHGANCVVVACPMCHVNLDMKQRDIERRQGARHQLMVYYISDLIGLALGIGEHELGIDRHFVSAPLAAVKE
jgi:heterodisulfide reductase subunit B